jgi:hypothetical protein
MADNVRVTKALALVKLIGDTDAIRVSKSLAYVKYRAFTDETRATKVMAYVKVQKPWPTTFAYRVKDLHDQALTEDEDVVPQPGTAGVRVTRRNHSVSGGLKDDFLYAELVWSSLGSVEEFQSVLSQFGILAADENEVTITARSQTFQFRRYNGTAVRPQQGIDVRWDRYFPRNIVILVKFLEELD